MYLAFKLKVGSNAKRGVGQTYKNDSAAILNAFIVSFECLYCVFWMPLLCLSLCPPKSGIGLGLGVWGWGTNQPPGSDALL